MKAAMLRFPSDHALPCPITPEPPADGHAPAHVATEPVWPAWVQRCGAGSSCNCHPGAKIGRSSDVYERFAPGTAVGQKLLAHEITHVLQQRRGGAGTGSGAPVQRQPVPGESAEGAPPSGPPPMTGEQVQFHGVTLSQNPAQLRYAMEQLIINGRPMPLGNSLPPGLGSLQSFRFDLNRSTFAQMSEEWVCKEQPADDPQCRLALKIRPILDPILDDLERTCNAEVERFRDAARRNTVKTLDANKQQARAEMVRYGITEKQVERMRTELVVVSAGMDIWSEQEVPYKATEYRMGEAPICVSPPRKCTTPRWRTTS